QSAHHQTGAASARQFQQIAATHFLLGTHSSSSILMINQYSAANELEPIQNELAPYEIHTQLSA
ncbi:MAG: hypothetical protein OXG68_08225, partial [Chloroflexi bacterium]|nr:hypothetical protein [Chloroflexota bacterium]